MANRVFLDASYAIALSSPKDKYHQQAISLANIIEENKTKMITTRAVLIEIGNALAKSKYRQACVELITSIENDTTIEIIPVSEHLIQRAFELFQQRMDKEWGITDCISFIVMKDYAIADALSTDDHFRQSGFNALLLTE